MPQRPPHTVAVVLATAVAEDGRPAALLRTDGPSVLARLLAQLQTLGVTDAHVLVAPSAVDAVAAELATLPGLATELHTAAASLAEPAAADSRRTLVLVDGDVVAHREALARVLADPRVATGTLAADGEPLGLLKVAGPDRLALAAAVDTALAARRPAATPPSADRLPAGPAADLPVGGRTDPSASAADVFAAARAELPDLVARPLGPLGWHQPRSEAELDAALAALAAVDEDRVRLDAAVKATDGFFTTFLVSPYSRHIARWCADRGLTPNQVTVASMAVGVLAAAGFATGERWGLVAGAVLLQAAFTLDCVDGQLARYTRQFSALGAWLDSVFDRTKEYLVYAGLAIGAGGDVWLLAGAALGLQTARHMADFSFAAATARPAAPMAASQRLDATPGLMWVKRVLAFPIGERFAVISLTAALWSAHTTFVALLVCGGVAGLYVTAGRVARTVSRA